jgi:hypothetical protein
VKAKPPAMSDANTAIDFPTATNGAASGAAILDTAAEVDAVLCAISVAALPTVDAANLDDAPAVFMDAENALANVSAPTDDVIHAAAVAPAREIVTACTPASAPV